VVQSGSYGVRLKAQLLKDEFGRFGPMMHLLLRYTQALITQMAQTGGAIGTIQLTSNCAGGCCLASIVWRRTNSL
jgi:hypothetical protein